MNKYICSAKRMIEYECVNGEESLSQIADAFELVTNCEMIAFRMITSMHFSLRTHLNCTAGDMGVSADISSSESCNHVV